MKGIMKFNWNYKENKKFIILLKFVRSVLYVYSEKLRYKDLCGNSRVEDVKMVKNKGI
nr:hypothetical protein [uncultured Anaerostipes sp.]